MENINIDDLMRVSLKVVNILEAERVEGSDKLIKLLVDIGDGTRQIIAGIGRAYEPADLIGKDIVVVANLEPRMLMGLESQGMVLAAGSDEGPVLLRPDRQTSPGSSIR